jgi:hypothetical protein
MSLDLLFIIALALWQLWMVGQKDGKRLNSRREKVPMLYLKNGNTKFISKSQFDP